MFSRQWEAARDEARDLDKYAPNWDGEGADPVALELIQETLRLFRLLEGRAFPAPDMVYPAADGTVFVEWHHPGGGVDTANITPDRIHVVAVGADGKILALPSDTAQATNPQCDTAPVDGDAFEFTIAA